MSPQIEAARKAFQDIIIDGIPHLLQRNETAFLSFMCSVAAIDALAGYRYANRGVGDRFESFVKNYFPDKYKPHAGNLYLFRCRLLHNFSPAHFTVMHAAPNQHLTVSTGGGDTILSDESFFNDLKSAADKFFAEVQSDSTRQADMSIRLADINKGGAIYS